MRRETLALVSALFASLASGAEAQEQPFTAAVNGTANTVTVTWSAVTGSTGYILGRTADTTATPTILTPTPISTRSFTDVLPTAAATYYYRVSTTVLRQRLLTPWVRYTVPATLARPTPIAPAPVNLQPVTGLALSNPLPNGVTLTWGTAPGAVGYHVYRKTTTAMVQRTQTPITALTFTDRDALDSRVTYAYTVSAITADGLTADASVNFTPPPPQDPGGFTATLQGADEVVLRWKPVPGALHYLVAGSQLGTGLQTPDTSLTIRPLAPGATYNWTVATAYAPTGAILTPAASWPKASVTVPIWGFADLHVHQFNNIGFGGLAFHGSPFGPMDQALTPCTQAHGFDGATDFVGAFIGQGYPHHNNGHPDYIGWPRWNTTTHQQVYADWLKRAHDGGLQLMAMLAGNNPFLCILFRPAPGRTCDDTEALDRELAAAKQMEQWIDSQHGGPGKGWYRIVYSPKQAREAIAKGQLAVVLGIEMPTVFGCYEGEAYRSCTPDHVRASVKKYYDLGVRQITPIHSMDNAFGGTAMYFGLFTVANFFVTGHGFEPRDCRSEGVLFQGGQCNKRGLSSLGDFYLRELMSQKILIDVDHMSRLSLEGAFRIAQQYDYPVMTSHSWFMQVSQNEKRAEGHLEQRDFQRIRELGGLVSVITAQGGRSEIATFDGTRGIPHDCGYSSQSFVQAYLHGIREFGGPIAFGTDFNGFAGQPAPRFGPDACRAKEKGSGEIGPKAALGGPMPYPFSVHGVSGRTLGKSKVGTREYDYNVDGLAHIGMLPDLVQDMKTMGVSPAELEPLFRSAEQYIRMWEKVESRSVPAPPPPGTPVATAPLPTLKVSVAEAPSATRGSTTLTVSAVDAATGQPRSGTVMVGTGKGGVTFVTGVTGQALTIGSCTQYDAKSRRWERVACSGTVGASGYANARFTVGQAL
jgi:microsomal dipeptidase-like Zn-dependent dipeptidase